MPVLAEPHPGREQPLGNPHLVRALAAGARQADQRASADLLAMRHPSALLSKSLVLPHSGSKSERSDQVCNGCRPRLSDERHRCPFLQVAGGVTVSWFFAYQRRAHGRCRTSRFRCGFKSGDGAVASRRPGAGVRSSSGLNPSAPRCERARGSLSLRDPMLPELVDNCPPREVLVHVSALDAVHLPRVRPVHTRPLGQAASGRVRYLPARTGWKVRCFNAPRSTRRKQRFGATAPSLEGSCARRRGLRAACYYAQQRARSHDRDAAPDKGGRYVYHSMR